MAGATGNIRKREIGGCKRVLLNIILAGFAVLTIYPILWLFYNSFKTTTEFFMNPIGLPRVWTTINYPATWRIGGFGVLIINSCIYVTATTAAVIFLSLAAGFAFAKIRSFATPVLHGGFVIGILLTIQSLIIPLFMLSSWIGLYNTRWAVLIPYVGLGLPIGIYLCTEFIKGIPDAVMESARIDGAGYFRIFSAIVAPMARPVVTTLAVLTFVGTINEFVLIFILTRSEALKSLPVGMMKFSSALSVDYGKQFTALTIGLLPVLLFYLIFHKRITQGVSVGAVKG